MKICKDNKWKIILKTQYSYFKCQIMSFGLSNIPRSFQGYINKILAEKLNIFVIIYLDNTMISTKNLDQRHTNLVK